MTTEKAKNHSPVVIEGLKISGRIANHKLAEVRVDLKAYKIRKKLEYKCQRYVTKLIVADGFFPWSQLCYNCINQQLMPLSQRIVVVAVETKLT